MIDLSIIIVNWNVAALLAACLDSIFTHAPAPIEVIVVDSDSSDGSVAMLRERYPQVKLLAQSENVGFTRGNNIGFQAAAGRYLLMLNPDTEIIGSALSTMIAYMDAHPDVGILGPKTYNTDGSVQSTRRRFPTVTLAFFESTWLQNFAPRSLTDHYYVADQPDDGVFDVDWVQGSALMARREFYAQTGGLDERYTMYSEELDWCKRAKNAGWRVIYLGSAEIIHHGGKSTDQASARKHIHFEESKLRYFRKHHGRAAAYSLWMFLIFNYVWQIVLEMTKGLLGSKRAMRRERIKIYWQVLRSGLKVTG